MATPDHAAHSPEAIAGYPDIEPNADFPTGWSYASERTAFDRGWESLAIALRKAEGNEFAELIWGGHTPPSTEEGK
jgi:hypothetical protein